MAERGNFFDDLATDDRKITLDADVIIGGWPSRADLDFSPAAVQAQLDRGGITGALVCSGQGVWAGWAEGNAETRTIAAGNGWTPCATVNLRDAWPAADILDEALDAGVRAVRLFPVQQQIAVNAPALRHVIDEANARSMLMLTEGDFPTWSPVFEGKGARVVLLDMHYYTLADFLLVARREPGFIASTRKLGGPTSIAIGVAEVGASHFVYGSGAPLQDIEPTAWHLRDADISADDWAAITGGNLRALLEAA